MKKAFLTGLFFVFSFAALASAGIRVDSALLSSEYVKASFDLGVDLSDGFTATIDPSRVTIDAQSGIVTIRPNLVESAEFLRVFVPSDK